MNKFQFLIALVFIVLGMIAQSYLPWYSLAILAALCTFLDKTKPTQSFIIYFLLGGILWSALAIYIDITSASRLSSKIGVLFGNLSVAVLIVLTGIVGGITSGLGALVGSLSRSIVNGQ